MIGIVLATLWVTGLACWQINGGEDGMRAQDPSSQVSDRSPSSSNGESPTDDAFADERHRMVQQQLAVRDVREPRVLQAMRKVPRHLFVSEEVRSQAYSDGPLPIGYKQTISQPYIVGLMTQLAEPDKSSIALDVGTGSGYQAAVLSLLCKKVYSIEIVEPLAKEARERLDKLGYDNVTVRHGDGYQGWPEKAPFDLILVAAAPDHVPQALVDQLTPGGHLVIPVGRYYQNLLVIEKKADGTVKRRKVASVAFVPMTGDAQKRD